LIKNKNIMKRVKAITTRFVTCALALLFTAGLIACSDEDTQNTGVTEADVADAIEASLTAESNGVAKMAADVSELAKAQSVYTARPDLACGEFYTVQYHPTYTGPNFSYDYSGTRVYSLFCGNEGTPMSFDYDSQLSGTYETPRMLSDDNATANVSFTNLTGGNTTNINGSYIRNGSQQSKVRLRRSFSSVIRINLYTVSFDKISREITGGTATVSITGTGVNTFYYNGSITFNRNNTATLTINGTTYTINL